VAEHARRNDRDTVPLEHTLLYCLHKQDVAEPRVGCPYDNSKTDGHPGARIGPVCKKNGHGKRALAHETFNAGVNRLYRNGQDGGQRYQSVRLATWVDRQGKKQTVRMVVNTIFAAWVLVDEIHSAGSKNTQTYKQVIDPFNALVRNPALRPSYTAITGSALANGVVTVLSFALKALLRKDDLAWTQLDNKAVELLRPRDVDETLGTWKKFLKAFQRKPGQDMRDAIAANPGMKELIQLFAEIVGTYFIARDYESVDAWGKRLNILDCRLNSRYRQVRFAPPYHQILHSHEQGLRALVVERYAQDMDDWIANGSPPNARPRPTRYAAVDPKQYYEARVLANFPNLIAAVKAHEARLPTQQCIFPDLDDSAADSGSSRDTTSSVWSRI
jgi:hypothetical protein